MNNDEEMSLMKGALSAIRDECGHQNIVSSIQCLQYDLDFKDSLSLESARAVVHKAFVKIKSPVQVKCKKK